MHFFLGESPSFHLTVKKTNKQKQTKTTINQNKTVFTSFSPRKVLSLHFERHWQGYYRHTVINGSVLNV